MLRLTPSLCLAALLAAPPVHAQVSDSARVAARPPGGQPNVLPNASPDALPNAQAGDGCTYDACALRVEEGMLVRGADGRRVTTPSLFGSYARGVDWRSDAARQFARRADAGHRTARLLQSVGALASLAGAGLALQAIHDGQGAANAGTADGGEPAGTARVRTGRIYTAVGLGLGSTLLGWAGNAADRGARQQLARAVWWHNRELVQPR